MNIVTLEQNTELWLQWRDTGLGASDAATILGISPYVTPYELWLIKTGRKPPPDLSKNPHVRRGNKLEPLAKAVAEKYIGEKLYALCASEFSEDFILASFDGITINRELVCELKCPHESTFNDVVKKGKKSQAYIIYWVQVQQQLLVSKAKKGLLIFFLQGKKGQKNQIVPFEIKPDIKFQTEVLTPALKSFWECIKNDTPPKRDALRDPCEVDGNSWLALTKDYRPLKEEQRKLEAQVKQIKEAVKPYEDEFTLLMGDNHRANEAGISATKVVRKGNVDYSSLIDELLTSLSAKGIYLSKDELVEKYRNESTESYRFYFSGDTPQTEIEETSDSTAWF